MNINRFQIGHGMFNCCICKRRTRGNHDSVQHAMCAECLELAEWDNHHNDYATLPTTTELEYYDTLLAKIGKRGGDMDRVMNTFDYIWTGYVD